MKGNFVIGCIFGGLLAMGPALAADSILDPVPGPCAGAVAGPDYVPGADAYGRPVPAADAGARPVPLPDQVLVPLPGTGPSRGGRAGRGAGGPAYATIDGRRLAPLVNPKPCAVPARSR